MLRKLEEIYGALESISVKVMKECLEARKIMMMTEEPIRAT